MSRLLAVAARELRERWLLFPAALVLGCVPLVLPAFGLKTAKADLAFVALFIALVLGAAAAVIIGTTMLARDVANGRLGFLFSRPLPWGAIWGGKWLAAILLVTATGLLASLPWMAVYPLASLGGHHGDSWLKALLDGPGAALCLTLIVLIVGLANLSTVALRSRSAWLVVDGALLLASLWATWRFVAPLVGWGIIATDRAWAPVMLALPATLAFVVASTTQVAVGRSDLHRAHRAASLGFWAVITLSLALAAGYLNWALSVGPGELRTWAMTRDPAGRWVFLGGETARSGSYPHGLLVDTKTGRYVRRGPTLGLREVIEDAPSPGGDVTRGGAVFSASGRACALPGYDASHGGARVVLFDLTAELPRPREVVLESSPPPSWASAFALSPSAASLFMVHESGASLFDLASGRRLATVTIKPGWWPVLARFLTEGQARAWLVASVESRRAEIAVVDLALDGRSHFVSFAVGTTKTPGWGSVMPNDDGTRLLTRDGGVRLRDGADGRVIATLTESGGRPAAAFLADGRIVVGEGAPGIEAAATAGPAAALTVFDATGVRLGTVRVPIESTGLSLGPEVAPGRILVSAFRSPFLREDTLVVDVGDGRVVERLEGLRPAIGFWTAPAEPGPGSGPRSVQFFRDTEGRVVRVDFATGERRTVAGPGAPKGERLNLF
jgi:hypothetical protein